MESATDQAELFPFPTAEAKARRRSPLREMLDAIAQHGPLIPQAFVHVCLDMTKQRAHQLLTAGRIATVEVAGKRWVPMAAVDIFLSEERKSGRPGHLSHLGGMLRRAVTPEK